MNIEKKMKRSIYKNRIMNNTGSTLIEVLVTIFVLTSGLLVLFGMFPQGFNILRNSKNVGFAGSLLKDRSAIFQMRNENMPFAIIPCDNNGDTDSVINVNPNEGKPNAFLIENDDYVKNGNAYVRGSLINSRKVVGESVVIPGGDYWKTANGDFYGGKYTVLFGPIDTTRNSSNKKLKRVVVHGSVMNDISNGNYSVSIMDLWNDASYASYWVPGMSKLYLAFTPDKAYGTGSLGYERIYKISYLVRNLTTGQVFRKEGYITLGENYSGGYHNDFCDFDLNTFESKNTVNLLDVESGNEMITDSLEICRVFEEITPGNSFTKDPYQYMMADPVVGTIMFNPIGSQVFIGEDGDKSPLRAYIDYMIYDPRITVKDIQFPRNGDYEGKIKINLGLGTILCAGDLSTIGDGTETENPDEPTFEGLIRGTKNVSQNQVELQIGKEVTTESDLVIPQSILIMDTQTGLRVFPQNDGDIEIDYENGIVSFASNIVSLRDWYNNEVFGNVSVTDRVLRFYFRPADDWIVRMVKLPSNFKLSTDGTDYHVNDSLKWNEYGFKKNTDRIYFPQAYAGNDVLVDFVDKNNKTIFGKVTRISDYPEDGEASCYADLGKDAKEIISVQGASISLGAYWRIGREFKSRQMVYNIYDGFFGK